ncbi:MAG: alpha/beta hydrolase-fold protein [Microscillaceae bacterium]|nr:alpha/beta hydrolase-fold protein [Microscillaceae bacterium]MDW8459755.1 alpha/beta hydrolase-fold protein [Cytophagales bacterium]
MHKEIHQWWSPRLHKEMPIAVYGHYGFALLLIPTAAADFLEYERFYLIHAIRDYINAGKVKVFSVNSINSESWLNKNMHPRDKSIRHTLFNEYIYQEVVPFIYNHCHGQVPIITCGASFGALHSANLFFKRPDLITGIIAMSGVYDLGQYTDGYWDDDCYFNSPEAYIYNMPEGDLLNSLRNRSHIHILTGQGAYEAPEASRRFSRILHSKKIQHDLDIWGYDMPHDWETWRAMLPYVLGAKF